ncbi:hypothetical protein H5410_061106 [Solanum commersonii]|uniref:Uncharacterized protein n=1 Tax=Solanum commersonii TaxID=4109 RepID=A0A9J5W7Z1_SOLCO|nr:hypothetical protein H5410_061106 [Solanum commersonii]
MNAHNKTQFTYAKITCVLKDSNCDTPLPKILMLATLATCASSSSTKVSKFPHLQRSHSKRGTQCIFSPIVLSLFFNQHSIRLTQDQKGLSKACNEAKCKGMSF